ncbi:MAG: hypothetical protein AB1571_00990 [Nanoarchaeota archaeon]
MPNTYFNKLKKYTTITLASLLLYSSFGCIKRVPIENFIKTNTEEKIDNKIEEIKEYKINNINYLENKLNISISEITKQNTFKVGERKTYDLYQVGVREEFNGKAIGTTIGIIGSVASFAYGIYSVVNPPTTEECMDYKTSKGTESICKEEKKFPVLGTIILTVGTGSSIGLGYGISKIKKVYKENYKEEMRNIKKEDINLLNNTKILDTKPFADTEIELSSDYFLFNDKNNIKLLTGKDGRIKVNIKGKDNFSFTKEELYQTKLIKDLKYLGMGEEINEVIKNVNETEHSFNIKFKDEEKNILLKGYELPESKLEELLVK